MAAAEGGRGRAGRVALQQQLPQHHQRNDAHRDRDPAQEQRSLEASVGPQVALERAAGYATSPIAPVFSVFSHTISVPRISLTYAAAVIAHSSGP